MKKFLATVFLLLAVSVTYAGAPPTDNAIPSTMICHDKEGKWNPQDKNCDPTACGCLFHQILDLISDALG